MYGLLGKKLGHSFSKDIHETFTDKDYQLIELNDVSTFMSDKKFSGINVTIPYKKTVIPYIDKLSVDAKEIGVVNTILNKEGILFGYNTDIDGLSFALDYNNVSVSGKDVIIIGNGSTSRTIKHLCKMRKARKVTIFARNPLKDQYLLTDLNKHSDASILFNATPVGMFPNNLQSLNINFDELHSLEFVMDVVYNPLSSNLLLEAKKRNIKTENGLLMLVTQATKAIELFHGINVSDKEILTYYKNLLIKTNNFVFIGMPMSGKSFLSRLVGKLYNKDVIDLDYEITKTAKISIPEIFETKGEKHFRELEHNEVIKYSKLNNKAISCGGGVILDKKNVHYLKQNGVIIFIDFPLEELLKCNPKDRPLLKNSNSLEKLYKERYNLYRDNADIIISKKSFDQNETMTQIEEKISEYFNT